MRKETKENIINLESYCIHLSNKVSKVFTGRDRGEEVREKSKIDEIYDKYKNITIIIPKGTFSITPSFLEEFFVNIVKKYGTEEFRKNIHIVDNGYVITAQLDEAIDRILQRKTALDK